MIALKVSVNGKVVCIAGAEDLCVLNAMITATGKLGKKTATGGRGRDKVCLEYAVGGLTRKGGSKKDFHKRWKDLTQIKIGDVIQVELIESSKSSKLESSFAAKVGS